MPSKGKALSSKEAPAAVHAEAQASRQRCKSSGITPGKVKALKSGLPWRHPIHTMHLTFQQLWVTETALERNPWRELKTALQEIRHGIQVGYSQAIAPHNDVARHQDAPTSPTIHPFESA